MEILDEEPQWNDKFSSITSFLMLLFLWAWVSLWHRGKKRFLKYLV